MSSSTANAAAPTSIVRARWRFHTAATSTGDVSATRNYTFAGSTVAMRTSDPTVVHTDPVKLFLLLGDEQGSTSVVMPVHEVAAAGEVPAHLAPATLADASDVTRTSYTPYGELRGADNAATDRGWLGQVEDRVDGASGTGLTYLNARYYDPATSRFISPDPLMNPGDPRTLDAYMYSSDNPVVYTDASGLRQDVGNQALNDEYYSKPANKGVNTYTGLKRKSDDRPGVPRSSGGGSGAAGSSKSKTAGERASDIGFETMQDWLSTDLSKYFVGYSDKAQLNYAVQCGAEEGKSLSVYGNGSCYLIKNSSLRMLFKLMDLQKKFQPYGPWDVKPILVDRMGLPGDSSDPTRDLDIGGGQTMYYDVIGNVQYGYMMSSYGVTEKMAILASKASGSGNPDGSDDAAIGIGYAMHSELGDGFTARGMYDFMLNPANKQSLVDAKKILGAG
ncbi:MAG: hypothetical protein HGA51_00505 [Demequinaceae bacterium]|nr:hypothetical protein [Demequinaceae bacterium]